MPGIFLEEDFCGHFFPQKRQEEHFALLENTGGSFRGADSAERIYFPTPSKKFYFRKLVGQFRSVESSIAKLGRNPRQYPPSSQDGLLQPSMAQVIGSKMSDVQKWIQTVGAVAKVTNSLDTQSSNDLPLLVEVSKTFLKGHCTKMIQDSAPEAVVTVQRSCDCTNIKVRQHYMHKSVSDSSRGSVRMSTELFVAVVYISVGQGGSDSQHAVVFREPAQLQRGKAMPNLLSYMLATPGVFLGTGPCEGITLHHQIHDRGISARFRAALAGAVAECQSKSQEPHSDESNHLLHFHTSAGCCLHDGHNSLKWAYEHLFSKNVELLKALHIAIGAIRDSMLKCYHGLGTWLANVVHPLPLEELPTEETRLQFFQIMGAPADLMADLVEAGVWWHSSKHQLQVKASFLQMEDSLGRLTTMLMNLWRPQAFTASRWGTIGSSCRSVALALSSGLLSLYRHLKMSGSISDYEAHGSDLLQQDEICFLLHHRPCLLRARVLYRADAQGQ